MTFEKYEAPKRTTKSDLVDIIRVINRRLEKNGYNRRLKLEYRGGLGSNVHYIDLNGSQHDGLFYAKKTGELYKMLMAFWKGLSLGLMSPE